MSPSQLRSSRTHAFAAWLQAATGRWVFDFQHRRPCFAALNHVWKEIVQFHGWRPISTTCADELLSCICMAPLIYTDMRAHLSSRVFCADASNFGAGACETIGLTTAGEAAGRGEAVRAGSSDSGKFQQKSRPRRWCLGSSDVQITGALMCVSICSCPFGLTHGHGLNLSPEVALASDFEFSVEKARCAHQ